MYRYYLSTITNDDGSYTVHIMFCPKGIEEPNRENLGFHLSGNPAIERARIKHPEKKIVGCEYCCPDGS